MRRIAAALVVALACCTSAPAAPSPAPSAASQRAVPSATVLPSSGLGTLTKLADGTLVVSVPDCTSTTQGGAIAGCEVFEAAADRAVFVAILRTTAGMFEARSIDLASGEMRVLRPRADVGMHVADVRGQYAIIEEDDVFGGGSTHARLLRIPWADPAHAEVLDEIDLVGLGGGDTWNPWPAAKTNGRETVWLHAGGLVLPHQVMLQSADGTKQSIFETDKPVFFDVDESGRVAIASPPSSPNPPVTQELSLYASGSIRRIASRPIEQSGYAMSFSKTIGWTLGTGAVRFIDGVELIPVAGGASKTIKPDAGCLSAGRTANDIVSVCPSGVRLVDAASGSSRAGPPSRIVLVSRGALLWRTAADLAANPQVYRITPQ
jgi:hypothetical protein